jgi:hypothetical protein
MLYPPGDQDKLQKAFLACTPFNMLLAHYFSEIKKDETLINYLDNLAKDLVEETLIRPQLIIDQIEEEYEKYLITKNLEIEEDS